MRAILTDLSLLSETQPPGESIHRGSRTPHDIACGAPLDEIGRCGGRQAKQAYAEGAPAIVEEIAARLAPADPRSARGRAIGLFTMMVGTLQLSRALADRKFADEVLERGVENARTFMTERDNAATTAAVQGRSPAERCAKASSRARTGTLTAPLTPTTAKEVEGSATNCSWNWKMPPWPASG